MAGVIGISEIAGLANVSKQAVTNWRTRSTDFPDPVAELKSGPIFDEYHVLQWLAGHNLTSKSELAVRERLELIEQGPLSAEVAAEVTADLLTNCPWRVGRKVGRTIYAQVGENPSDDDVLIGMMDSRELARAAVEAYNQAHAQPKRTE